MADTQNLETSGSTISARPVISVVTTSFNAARTIERTIQSILTQEGSFTLEYIVTDAGSRDDTRAIVERYAPRVTLVDAQGLSQSAGINLGLQQARGDILTFLNADDIYLPGALERVAAAFRENPAALWLIGQARIIDEQDREMQSWITRYKNLLLSHYSYFLLLTENFVCQPSVFFTKEAFARCGLFSEAEHYVMDYDYWLRLGQLGPPIIVQEDLSCFRRMPTTKSNTGFVQQFKDDMRVAMHYAKRTGNYLAVPIKFFNFLKTVGVYSIMARRGAL